MPFVDSHLKTPPSLARHSQVRSARYDVCACSFMHGTTSLLTSCSTTRHRDCPMRCETIDRSTGPWEPRSGASVAPIASKLGYLVFSFSYGAMNSSVWSSQSHALRRCVGQHAVLLISAYSSLRSNCGTDLSDAMLHRSMILPSIGHTSRAGRTSQRRDERDISHRSGDSHKNICQPPHIHIILQREVNKCMRFHRPRRKGRRSRLHIVGAAMHSLHPTRASTRPRCLISRT
jgi:hypothetical protein